ncbi:MAG: hypothetical protein HKN12_03365 [Gemmatimonadetes bacterium]|nr:hypothetical protein [Gemmatimonadota bacterium]
MNAFSRTPFRFVSLLAGLVLACLPSVLRAEVNSAFAGIGGVNNGTLANGDGTGAARIEILSVPLALVKQARAVDGTVLSDGAGVTPGQELYFLLYVENPTDHPAMDVRITDVLDDTQFTFLSGTIEDALVPEGATDAAIWAATWNGQTDALGSPQPDDQAAMVGNRVTVGAVPQQVNQQFAVPAHSLRAVRFRVRVN